MAIKLGSTDINSLNLGSINLNKIYSGSDTVFGGAAPYVPFLENLTASPDFAWSVWQPHSSVTNCVRLRRNSDDAELDFGYVDGYLDTASITSWGVTDDLFVVTFYGYGVNATELTRENQFQWVLEGGVDNQAGVKMRQQGTSSNSYYALSSTLIFNVDFTTSTVFKMITNNYNTTHPTLYHVSTARYWLNISRLATDWRIILTPNTPSFVGVNQAYSANDDYLFLLERDVSNNIINTTNNIVIEDSNPYTQNRNASRLFSRMDVYQDLGVTIISEILQSQNIFSTEDKAQYTLDYKSRFNQLI